MTALSTHATATPRGTSSGATRRPPVKTLKTAVVRIGSKCVLDNDRPTVDQIRDAWLAGNRVVVVHGPGDEPDVVNRTLVANLAAAGVAAVGLSGADLGLARSTPGTARLDAVRLRRVLEEGSVAVLSPLSSSNGAPTPTCPDALAHAAAACLGADSLELLGDASLAPRKDPETGKFMRPTKPVDQKRVEALLGRSDLDGDVRDRLVAARAALLHGVRDVRLQLPV